MRKIIALVISFILVFSMFAIENVEASKNFKDVSSKHRFYEEISFLTEKGAISGFSDGTFKPGDYVTRAQSAVIVSNILDLPYDSTKQIAYKDVLNTKWFYEAIQTLAQHKVLSGFKDGTARPDTFLTRGEAAKIISLAFNLKAENESAAKFTDVAKGNWSYTYINKLVENGITNGKTATKFEPEKEVTRGEFSAFIKRAYDVQMKQKTISAVSDVSIIIDNKTYQISTTLNKFLNVSNANVLNGAKIIFTEENNTIISIQSLTIMANGTADQMLTFDGQSGTLDGNLSINGDNVLLKNITVNGDLFISENVKTSFTSDHVTVKGKTILENDGTVKVAATNDPIVTRVKIVFVDSSVAIFEIMKKDVSLYAEGTTSFSSMSIFSNVNIFADPDIIIPKVEMKNGATRVELNVTIQDIIIESNENIEIGGRGNVDNITINSDKNVDLQLTGQVGKITATGINSNIVLGSNVLVKDIVLPEGKLASDVISNYDSIKQQIENIEGIPNPDYPSSADEGSYTPPIEFFDVGLLRGSNYGYVKLNIKNQKADAKVKIQVVDGDVTELASVGDVVPDNATEYTNENEFILWKEHVVHVYHVDSTGKILDSKEIDNFLIWRSLSIDFNFESRTILVQTREKVNLPDIRPQDLFTALYFYSGEEIYHMDPYFVDVAWENTELPSFILPMPNEMSEAKSYLNYYYYITPQGHNSGHSHYGKGHALHEITSITLLKTLANNDEDSWNFASILDSFTQESSENRYVKMSYFNSYMQEVKTSATSLLTRQDFIDLVERINTEKQVN